MVPNVTSASSSDRAAMMLPISRDWPDFSCCLASQNKNLLDVLGSNFVDTVRPIAPAITFRNASSGNCATGFVSSKIVCCLMSVAILFTPA
jgi:hypothetical protein